MKADLLAGSKRIVGMALAAVLAVCAVFSPVPSIVSGSDMGSYAAASLSAPASVKVVQSGGTALKLTWRKVDGASGYAIYCCDGKAKKFKMINTVKGASKTSWKNAKLAKNKAYKYKVRAYTKKGGKLKYGGYSYEVSAGTYTKSAKKANVSKLEPLVDAYSLGLNRVVNATDHVMVSLANNEKGKKKAHSEKLYWSSSDPSIVKVDAKGWLAAQGKAGKAKVYVRAHNGLTKALKITVGDFARPARFSNLDKIEAQNSTAAAILAGYKDDICAVAAYLERLKSTTFMFEYNNGISELTGAKLNIKPIEAELENLLKNANMKILNLFGTVVFLVSDDAVLMYLPYDSDGEGMASLGITKVAPCWFYTSESMLNPASAAFSSSAERQ
jgi:hypothetical protein